MCVTLQGTSSFDVHAFHVITLVSYHDHISSDPFSVPSLTDSVTNSAVEYQVRRNDYTNNRLIAGYEVIRFGVPMIGQYVNAGRGSRVTISPAVPGAQYRITAWARGDGNRSATPAVVVATTGEAGQSLYTCVQIRIILYSTAYLQF